MEKKNDEKTEAMKEAEAELFLIDEVMKRYDKRKKEENEKFLQMVIPWVNIAFIILVLIFLSCTFQPYFKDIVSFFQNFDLMYFIKNYAFILMAVFLAVAHLILFLWDRNFFYDNGFMLSSSLIISIGLLLILQYQYSRT